MVKQQTSTSKNTAVTGQKELLVLFILALTLGLFGGYFIGSASSNKVTDSGSATHMDSHKDSSHSHSTFEVPANQAPTVSLLVTEDAKSGYNINLQTTNFSFAPQNVNQENVIGEGHAHLYVGDKKIGRIYGNFYHYDGHFDGTKTFRVTLNANDHSDYAVDGQVVESSVEVTHDDSDHSHNNEGKNDDHSDEIN